MFGSLHQLWLQPPQIKKTDVMVIFYWHWPQVVDSRKIINYFLLFLLNLQVIYIVRWTSLKSFHSLCNPVNIIAIFFIGITRVFTLHDKLGSLLYMMFSFLVFWIFVTSIIIVWTKTCKNTNNLDVITLTLFYNTLFNKNAFLFYLNFRTMVGRNVVCS